MWSPELETLDQLLGGAMPLTVIRTLFPDECSFVKGIYGLVACGDARLLTTDGAQVPPWRRRELFDEGGLISELPNLQLDATDQVWIA
jgi:hypothetical protein